MLATSPKETLASLYTLKVNLSIFGSLKYPGNMRNSASSSNHSNDDRDCLRSFLFYPIVNIAYLAFSEEYTTAILY